MFKLLLKADIRSTNRWNMIPQQYRLSILYLVLCLIIHAPQSVYSQSLQSDSLALVDLFNKTNGSGWVRSVNWSSSPLDEWEGVLVDGDRVTALVLSAYGLQGEIPESVWDLTGLKQLKLDHNHLTGLLDGVEALHNLVLIDLSFNMISGSIPPEIGSLSSLEELRLRSNLLTGPIPEELSGLTELRFLDLAGNALNGTLPRGIGSFQHLVSLALNNNQLTGALPSELGNLDQLTGMQLQRNNFSSELPEEIGDMESLVFVNLSSNQFTSRLPASLGQLKNVTDLFLEHNMLSGILPSEIASMTNLEDLRLHGNDLEGELPGSWSALSTVHRIVLDDNGISGNIPASWSEMLSLASLTLEGNSGMSGTLPEALVTLTGLEEFNISGTDLCEPATPSFQDWISGIGSYTGSGCIVDVSVSPDVKPKGDRPLVGDAYPNPTRRNVNVEIDSGNIEPIDIRIYDMLGRVMYSRKKYSSSSGVQLIDIDFQAYASGTYMLTIRTPKNVISQLIVKQ